MKVLITGSTAQQCSTRTAARTPTFSTLMAKALHDGGAEVTICEPSIYTTKEELAEYDSVLVGVAPPTSISANKVYPAFAMASRAKEIGNLSLFVDAPEPYKIQSSLKSCYLNMSDLQKDFYSRRKSYSELVANQNLRQEVLGFVSYLYTEKWPKTFYPAFPWSSNKAITQHLSGTDETNLVPVSLDSYLLRTPYVVKKFNLSVPFWTCDSTKTDWAKKTIASLIYDVVPTRANKWEEEDDTLERIKRSLGTLVSVYRSGDPWWSPALAQSLSCGIPVATEWRLSGDIGWGEWNYLATEIETMREDNRFDLSERQKSSYLSAIPTWEQAVEKLLHQIQLNDLPV